MFVIGEVPTEFTVHAAIIAKQSKALDALVNGFMKEAFVGKATFEDIEEDTFIRFSQFAYNGDYMTPCFTLTPAIEDPDIAAPTALHDTNRDELVSDVPVAEESMVDEPRMEDPQSVPDDLGWGTPTLRPKKPKKISKSSKLRQLLHDRLYDTETPHTLSAARCEVRQNSDPLEDYTSVFLGHAQLYVFAEKWGITSLKTLCLSKLHRTLTTFTLFEARRIDIVELLRYAFSNSHTPDLVDDMDELRSLVLLYTVCEVENLVHCSEFMLLIGEGGQLAQNLVQMLMQRVS